MTIDINIKDKYIDLWLDRGESTPDLGELRQQFPDYQITIFHSGSGDLASLTAELLKVNL